MPVLNGSFETGTTVIGEASGWTSTVVSAVELCGFGDTEDPWDLFTWSDFVSTLSGGLCVMHGDIYEEFQWGSGSFIDEWYSGWVTSSIDDFIWEIFNDLFIPGISASVDDFTWSVFSDIWVPGLVCLFDTIPVPFEDFENEW